MTSLLSTLLGACVGSFLNVCISRWKSGESLISPSSHCPYCQKSIFWYDNIPILSFLILGTRCRFCHKAISWQYPLVEGATAFLFWLSSVLFPSKFSIVASFVFASFFVVFFVSDVKWKLLPHPFTNLFILSGLVFSASHPGARILNLFQGASEFLLLGFVLYGTTLVIPKGLGGGDIKLGASLTIWLGLSKSLFALLLAFGLGSIMVVPLLFLKKVRKNSMIPFGPFMALGSLILWFWPESIKQLGVGL